MRSTRTRAVALFVVLGLAAAACGDDDDAAEEPSGATTGSGDTSPAPTATGGDTTEPATSDSTVGSTSAPSETSGPAPTSAAGGDTGECTADRQGGSIDIGLSVEPASFDPAFVAGSAATGTEPLNQIYDTLMQYDGETGEYVPRVAESLEPDDTFANWTLTLREGVTFGNGDPLTAEAVKASIERFTELSTGPAANLSGKITEIEVVDELTAVFHLDQPWAGFPHTLAIQAGMIVNTALADAAGEAFGADPTGAGVGAYELGSYAPEEEIVLTARDDYWDGPVCLETLRFVPQPVDATRFEAFEADDLDVTYLRDARVVDASAEESGIDYFVNAANVILLNAGIGAPSPTNDVNVRRGLQLALDVEAINDRANEGAGFPTSAGIAEGSVHYTGIEGPQQDVAEATRLLDQAKADGWNGTVRLICDNNRRDVALAIEGQWEAAGAQVEVEYTPDFNALINTVLVNQDFDASCWGQNIADELPWAGISNTLYSTSPSNYGGIVDAEMDEAIDALRVAATDDDVAAALATIQERWTATAPTLVLTAGNERTIYDDDVAGLEGTSNGIVFYDDAYLVD
jgi:peptide/nickel transport system substrate-binding protein